MEYLIKLTWDSDANVWVATSDDVAGLALESGSFDALIERLRYVVPEMLELNERKPSSLRLNFISERLEQVAL